MSGPPLAYFLTFTTYGTWLHGSDKGRGSVDRHRDQFGQDFITPSVQRQTAVRKLMNQSPYVMDDLRRDIVCKAIVELATEKSWTLFAVHVRSNHIHTVLSAEREPGRLISDIKAGASRALNAAGLDAPDRRRWTRHGSTLYLFSTAQVEQKIHYTLHGQGEPMSVHDGRSATA